MFHALQIVEPITTHAADAFPFAICEDADLHPIDEQGVIAAAEEALAAGVGHIAVTDDTGALHHVMATAELLPADGSHDATIGAAAFRGGLLASLQARFA